MGGRLSACGRRTGRSLGSLFSRTAPNFIAALSGIETVLEVTVAAEDDVELRRLTVTNRSIRSRQFEFTSYAELALAPHGADKAHPAFSKMFVETECLGPRCFDRASPAALAR